MTNYIIREIKDIYTSRNTETTDGENRSANPTPSSPSPHGESLRQHSEDARGFRTPQSYLHVHVVELAITGEFTRASTNEAAILTLTVPAGVSEPSSRSEYLLVFFPLVSEVFATWEESPRIEVFEVIRFSGGWGGFIVLMVDWRIYYNCRLRFLIIVIKEWLYFEWLIFCVVFHQLRSYNC